MYVDDSCPPEFRIYMCVCVCVCVCACVRACVRARARAHASQQNPSHIVFYMWVTV